MLDTGAVIAGFAGFAVLGVTVKRWIKRHIEFKGKFKGEFEVQMRPQRRDGSQSEITDDTEGK